MSTERRSGFGPGFSKDVDSILTAAQLQHLYPDEVRTNLRIAGMVLRDVALMPDYLAQEPEYAEPIGSDIDEGDEDDA